MSGVDRNLGLAARIEAWEAEARRLAALTPDTMVEMTMLAGGIRIPIPAPVVVAALQAALTSLSNLPDAEVTHRLGLIPVYELRQIPHLSGDGGFVLEPQGAPPTRAAH